VTTPSLRDVYRYFGPNFLAGNPNEAGNNAGGGTSAPGLERMDVASSTENGTGAQNGDLVFNAPEMFGGAVSWNGPGGGGKWDNGNSFSIDDAKLPSTQFGNVSRTYQVDPGTQLLNPRLQYDDPNYGQITPLWNIDTRDKLNDTFAVVAPSLAMAGIGALGMPAWAGQLVGLARGLGSGGGLNAGTLAGMAGSALGLPTWATTLGRVALSQALRRRNGG